MENLPITMNPPLTIVCEECGSEAPVTMAGHADETGKRIEWPKATVKPDGIYFDIDCRLCGAREQRVANSSNAD
jgi:hypothetical protein